MFVYVYTSDKKGAKTLLQVASWQGVGVSGRVSYGVLLCDFVAKIEVMCMGCIIDKRLTLM